MPLKIRFRLEGDAPTDPSLHAKGLRALVLNWIEEIDPVLSKKIHDKEQPKPYNISTISRQDKRHGDCWFELSVLMDELYAPILKGQGLRGNMIHLGQQSYRVSEVEVFAVRTYAEILCAAPTTAREFRFRQRTPTAHHCGSEIRKAILLPESELYFGSWRQRWNLYAPELLPQEIVGIVANQVAVTYCQGGTKIANIDEGRNFAGFVGDVSFALLKANTMEPEMRRALAALALFAEYCGTGVDTMRGMGETQLLAIL